MLASRLSWHSVLISFLIGCSGTPDGGPDGGVHEFTAWPERLSETGLLAEGSTFGLAAEVPKNAVSYAPAYPLWTNGAAKLRHLVLPEGATIDNTDGANWVLPVGTVAFKTFFFAATLDGDGEQPIETRALRQTSDGLDYAVYLWNQEGTEAVLREDSGAHPVEVIDFNGNSLTHVVPGKFDCRTCHESNPNAFLGLSDWQLSSEGGASQALFERGWLDQEPVAAEWELPSDDPLAREVLGYLVGNCVHCHNGSSGASSTYSLLPDVALDNLVDQRTTGSASVAGVRVLPGDPANSIVLQAMLANSPAVLPGPDTPKPMPPLGVQVVDQVGINLLRDWIAALKCDLNTHRTESLCDR